MIFRKLALKSVMKFGKYSDWTVVQLMSMNKHRYLIWVYYNSSHISFLDDILKSLGITEENIIEKPGVNPDFYENNRYKFDIEFDEMSSKVHNRFVNNWNRAEDRRDKNKRVFVGSKKQMQNYNQGRF